MKRTAFVLLAMLLTFLVAHASAVTQDLLANGSFESPYNAVSGTNSGGTVSGNFPSGWADNSRNQGKQTNNTYSQDIDSVSGSSFKTVLAADSTAGDSNPAPALFINQTMNAVPGRTLTATVWMKASASTTATMNFLLASSPFTGRASKSCSVTTSWQQFTLTFTPTVAEVERMEIRCASAVTLWLDEASVSVQTSTAPVIVSPSGSDSTGDGTLATPYQTISKAAASVYPGETVQIRAGTYRETITMTQSGAPNAPITFQPYPGEVVTISGTDPITSWDLESTNVYRATNMPAGWATLGDGNQVFQNGVMKPEARWPNAGSAFPWQDSTLAHPSPYNQVGDWSYVDSASYTTAASFVDAQLPSRADGYWNGATVHIMSGNGWIMGLPGVTSYTDSSKTIVTNDPNIAVGGAYTISAGNEYYLTGIKGEMDSDGEWFYDTGTSRLDYYSSTGPPANVEVKTRAYGFNISGRSYIKLVNLNFFGCTIQSNSSSTYETFDGLSMHYLGHSNKVSSIYGISLHNGDTLRNSELAWDSQALVKIAGNDIRVINNNLHDSGYVPYWTAMADAGSNPGSYYLRNLISHNTMHDAGRAIMGFPGLASIFEFNDLYNGMKETTDGAVFYYGNAQAGNTTIRYNKIHDSTAPVGHTGAGIRGLYLDNMNSECIVHHNLIWNMLGTPGAYALHLNARMSFDMVFNNTCWNCSGGSLTTSFAQDGPTGTKIYNNLLNGVPVGTPDVWNKSDLRYNLATDPLFVDPANGDFRLQASSPAVDAGTAIPGVTDGFSGAAPDLGALEFGGTDWRGSVGYNATPPSPDPAYAAPAMEFANKVKDGSFESGSLSSNWTVLGGSNVGLVKMNSWYDPHIRSGAYSAQFGGGNSEVSQVVTGLVPGARYKFYCGVQKSDASAIVKVGVRGYGDTTLETVVPTTDVWSTSDAAAAVPTMYELPFTMGPASTSATVYVNVVRTGSPVICPATSNTTVAPAVTVVAQANIPTAYPSTGVYVDDLSVERSEALPVPAVNLRTPLVQYLFEETSGTVAHDASGNARDATISSGTSSVLWQAGKFGNALGFDGVDDYALTPAISTPSAITVACWAKSNSATWNCTQSFVSQRPSFALGANGPGLQSIRFLIYSGPSTTVNLIWTPSASNGFAAFDITQWHHYAGVFNPATSRMELYVDGALVAWQTTTATINPDTGQVYIGKDDLSGSNRYLAGVLDDVRIYDYALSASDIAGMTGSSDSSQMLRLAFDESSGATTAADASGNARNGTLVNFNPATAWGSGEINGGLSFDGTSSYVTTPAMTTPSALTLACWAKSNTSTWNDSGCLISQRPSFVLSPVQGSRNMSFIIYSDANTQIPLNWTAPPGFDITQWHHYAGVFNPAASRMELYVDGSLVSALTTTATLNVDTGAVFIGKDDGANRYFSGRIDEVQIYARALAWNEVLELSDQTNAAPYYTPAPGDLSPPAIAAPVAGFIPLTLDVGPNATVALPDYTTQAVTSDNVGVTSVTQSPIAGGTVGLGTAHVTLTAFDAAGNSASLSFDVTVETPITSWRKAKFGAQWNNEAIAGDNANPSGDGISNLLKYALGLDPNTSSNALLPATSIINLSGTSYLTITFQRSISASDVNYTVQVAGSLGGGWSNGSMYSAASGDTASNGFTTQLSRTANGDVETIVIRDNVPILGTGQRFIRLNVTHP